MKRRGDGLGSTTHGPTPTKSCSGGKKRLGNFQGNQKKKKEPGSLLETKKERKKGGSQKKGKKPFKRTSISRHKTGKGKNGGGEKTLYAGQMRRSQKKRKGGGVR